MNLDERVQLLKATGNAIKSDLANNRLEELLFRVGNENAWFTKEFSLNALQNAVSNYLSSHKLDEWLKQYKFSQKNKRVGVIPAGNIPLVGLHDIIAVFISGNTVVIKPSKKDFSLINYVLKTAFELEPKAKSFIQIVDRLESFDAVIATGSNNTHRYFEQYFGKYPSVLRKNRTSVGVLSKETSKENLEAICDDMFMYFGLGCRSVSKLYLEDGFDLQLLLKATEKYNWLGNHSKYHNNYMYNKSVFLVNRVSHFDTGFSLFQESADLYSPISVVNFEFFKSVETLKQNLSDLDEKLQIVVSNVFLGTINNTKPIGTGQLTGLNDYADGVDTMKFLESL